MPDEIVFSSSATDAGDRKDISATKPTTGGRFNVIEQSDSKLVVRISPRGSLGCLGYFSALWLGVVCLMIPFALREVVAGKRDGWFSLLILLLFLMVGLGLAFAWARLRFTETLILLEPARVVVQRSFRRRKNLTEIPITPSARALLTTAYTENDKPVYRVSIPGETESATFGTAMAPEEKPRLVALINEFLEAHDSTTQAERAFPDVCPECGSGLARVLIDPDTGIPACLNCNRPIAIKPPEIRGSLELPHRSKIEVVESTDARQVIYVPSGGPNALAIGWMAAIWMVFMAIFTPPWFFVHLGAIGPPSFLLAILAFLWSIGFILCYVWIRLQFSRTFVLLERDRLVVQRVLFWQKATTETPLGPQSRASLVESYHQNQEPVYRVEVNGTTGYAKFGTAFSRVEKDWLVRQINCFLGVRPIDFPTRDRLPAACPRCNAAIDSYLYAVSGHGCFCRKCQAALPLAELDGGDATPEHVVELNPAELPQDSEVTLHFAEPDRLQFTLPLIPDGRVRRTISVLILPVAAASVLFVWNGFSGIEFGGGQIGGPLFILESIFKVVFPLFSCVISLVPLSLMAYVRWGRISVDLDATRFRCVWRLGPFGPKKELAPETITRVAITNVAAERKNRGEEDRRKGIRVEGSTSKGCAVFADSSALPLTTFHGIETARHVAGIVIYQLRRMGIDPADV